MRPVLRQRSIDLTQVKRPDLPVVPGLPTAQIVIDGGGAQARLFPQFTQRRLLRRFPWFNAAFDQLHPGLGMAEQEDPWRRFAGQHDGAGLVGAFAQQGLIDEYQLFVAGTFLGSQARPLLDWPLAKMSEAPRLKITEMRAVGDDWRVTAIPLPAPGV